MATILIIDEPATADRLATLLAPRGHRLLKAADGDEALQIAHSERPELVLADILMPKMDGYQFVQHLRTEPERIPPRLVFLAAAYLEAEAGELAQACGADKLVTKPARPETLLAVINTVLAARRPGRGNPLPAPGAAASAVRLIARKLYQRVTTLEGLNTRLELHAASCAERLETARSALEQEVTKRLWAEKELTQANLRLHDKAMRDALTGLYNRGYLEESLDREASRARRSDRPFGVMMIDIDHFKRCNDRHGHAAGDAVLRAVGQYMLSLARGEDILCRYGGEEFVLVMAQASPGTILERAETLRVGVQKLTIECDGRRVGPVTLSVGIAMFPDHGENGQAVLLAADSALYRAKLSGRNCIAISNAPKSQR